MNESTKEAGVIQVLAERLEKIRLPIALELKEKVDKGERLNDREIEYLEQVIADAQENRALVERNPEWKDVHGRVIGLYNEITEKALENEKNT